MWGVGVGVCPLTDRTGVPSDAPRRSGALPNVVSNRVGGELLLSTRLSTELSCCLYELSSAISVVGACRPVDRLTAEVRTNIVQKLT